MVTKKQAMAAKHGDIFHYGGPNPRGVMLPCARTVGPRGRVTERVVQARVTGRCATWKTRPDEFRLPVKHGLYESGAITHDNAAYWHRACDCALLVRP